MRPASPKIPQLSLSSSSPLPPDSPSDRPLSPRSPDLSSSGYPSSPSLSPSSRGWSKQLTASHKTPTSPRASHSSFRPKSVQPQPDRADGQVLVDSPSSFKLPKPSTANLASSERGPVSPRFIPNDARRSPVPKFNLSNDLESMPELPPLPSSSPLHSEPTNETPEDADVEGEIYIEILVREQYEIVELPDGDAGSSSALPDDDVPKHIAQWPSSPRTPGSGHVQRSPFLRSKPQDALK